MTKPKAFTIIELLVVVAIIAILIGILLPAIGKARDSAMTTRSQANLRQVAVAHASYASDHNDNQWTVVPHNLASYGASLGAMVANYNTSVGGPINGLTICTDGVFCLEIGWAYNQNNGVTANYHWGGGGTWQLATPIMLETGGGGRSGFFRAFQVKSFNHYLSGRFYDSVWYAPKDTIMIQEAGECFDAPGEFCIQSLFYIAEGTYILSPAALYAPDVFSLPQITTAQVYNMNGAFRPPTFSQARYPDLKTHMLERNWLQGPPNECNPHIPMPPSGAYCRPYRFNGGLQSKPVTLFYDGHIEMVGVSSVLDANQQAIESGGEDHSLWHHKTPFGDDGWFHSQAYSPPGVSPKFGSPANNTSSFHIFTRFGILGRDKMSD